MQFLRDDRRSRLSMKFRTQMCLVLGTQSAIKMFSDLLDAGINVIGAFNVQHLESLKDIVERVTGVVVRETIPDTFLKQADQVVNLDLAIEDLIDRLQGGKIYAPEKVTTALGQFFSERKSLDIARTGTCARLLKASIGRLPSKTVQRDDRHKAATARVMVCLASGSPRADGLLRRGSRLAGRLNTDWYAVYVETPKEAPAFDRRRSPAPFACNHSKGHGIRCTGRAAKGSDPVPTLINFAQSHAVGTYRHWPIQSGTLETLVRPLSDGTNGQAKLKALTCTLSPTMVGSRFHDSTLQAPAGTVAVGNCIGNRWKRCDLVCIGVVGSVTTNLAGELPKRAGGPAHERLYSVD